MRAGVIASSRRRSSGGSGGSLVVTSPQSWVSPITGPVTYRVQAPGGPAGARRQSTRGGGGGGGELREGTFNATSGLSYDLTPGVAAAGGVVGVDPGGTPPNDSTDATIIQAGVDVVRAKAGGKGIGGATGTPGADGAGGTGGTGGTGTAGSPGAAGVGGNSPWPASGGALANPGSVGGDPGGGGATGASGTGSSGGAGGPGRITLSW